MSDPQRLRDEAQRFRTIAGQVDEPTREYLLGLATNYEAEAERIDYWPKPEATDRPHP